MSLKLAAQHLADKGRGPDTMLIHMAPSEVAGLQALAKAAGGSLTVNPDTGLPEAGFLESLLPTIIGAGVTAATGGAAAPWMVGAGIGGLQALRTGSLTKGLTAGLGAYGGAGLTGGLMGLGTGALSQQAGTAAAQGLEGLAADQAAEQAIKERLANATVMDKLKAGVGTFEWNKPMDFVSGLGGGSKKMGAAMLGAAALPTVMQAVAPQQVPGGLASDRAMPRRLRYDIDTRSYVPISQQEAFNIRGYAAGGMPEWNPKWVPDTPGYGNQGQDFGREILYYNPKTAAAPEEAVTAKPAELKPVYEGEGGPGGAEGAGKTSGGSWSGLPGWAVDQYGVSMPTTGLASLANRSAAVLGNLGFRSLSDVLASQVDPNYGHEGMSGRPGGRTGPNLTGDLPTIQVNPISDDTDDSFTLDSVLAGNAITGGVTPAGAGVAANPMGRDPAQAGEAAGMGDGGFGEGRGAAYDKADGGLIALAAGGIGHLGGYSDGGRLLRGPGDGVSDSIPATIGRGKQPARLADGEFVVPARIVSELGNGSTEAGARKLYAMMDRIQKARRKTIGKGRVATNTRAEKLLPA